MAHASRDILAPAIVTVVGSATIAAAWGFELIGGYVPCALCLEERIPYYVGVPIAVVALLVAFAGGQRLLIGLLLLVVTVVFGYGTYLGLYHAGAEWGWWPGPADCAAGAAPPTTSAADILSQIQGMRVVSCTEASWRFPTGWGLSFAGWNAAASLLLALVALWGAIGAASRPSAYGSSSESQ
jgi:disulfide bond formation protein DsbB